MIQNIYLMKKIVVLTLIAIVILLGSCKSKKIVTEGERASSARHLVDLIQQSQPSFSTMNANNLKVNVEVNGVAYSSPASIKIITDSVIVFSVYPFLGMEMFSLELYPDKWIFYDRMNLKYAMDDYQFFSRRYGVNLSFRDFQSIFSAQFFELGGAEVNYKRYKFIPFDGDKHEIIFENEQVKQISCINSINVVKNISLQSKTNNYLLTVQYSDYAIDKGVNYPHNIIMDMAIDNKTNISLNMDVQKVSFNSNVKLSLANQDRYTRTTIDQILIR